MEVKSEVNFKAILSSFNMLKGVGWGGGVHIHVSTFICIYSRKHLVFSPSHVQTTIFCSIKSYFIYLKSITCFILSLISSHVYLAIRNDQFTAVRTSN